MIPLAPPFQRHTFVLPFMFFGKSQSYIMPSIYLSLIVKLLLYPFLELTSINQ